MDVKLPAASLFDTGVEDLLSQKTLRENQPLPPSFYQNDTTDLARLLIGKCIVHREGSRFFGAVIVETEAYLAERDAASHSACGKTRRNAAMFADSGTCYVYLSYGVHYCMNVVSARAGTGEAVLIRAVRPVNLITEMMSRRGLDPGVRGTKVLSVANGPGKLTAALGIDLKHNFQNFYGPELKIIDCQPGIGDDQIIAGPRIGITKSADLPLRFSLGSCPWVSRPMATVPKYKNP
jgi:DNA-3-methyladenine glycosylase